MNYKLIPATPRTGLYRCNAHGKKGDHKVGRKHCEVCLQEQGCVLDPVTGWMLDPSWKHPSRMPKPTDITQHFLVLEGCRPGFEVSNAHAIPMRRMQIARLNPQGVLSIGGAFDFDRPPIVAWQHPPAIFTALHELRT